MSGPKFKVDEGVLCYHGPHLYAAKCLDVQEQDGEWMYKVHYIGWNKTWDEYVDDPRILKDNAKNKELQKRLLYLAQVQSKNKGKGSRKKTSGKSKEARNDDKDEEFAREVEEKLALPDKIRKQLVDDWDDIVNHQLVVPLPRAPSVSTILDDFVEYCKSSELRIEEQIIEEVVSGLRIYFEQALPTLLLYDFERPQHTDLTKEHIEKDACDLYGAEHLVRLFVKLPILLAHTNMQDPSLETLLAHLQEFLKFLVENSDTYFAKTYQSVPNGYLSRVIKS